MHEMAEPDNVNVGMSWRKLRNNQPEITDTTNNALTRRVVAAVASYARRPNKNVSHKS